METNRTASTGQGNITPPLGQSTTNTRQAAQRQRRRALTKLPQIRSGESYAVQNSDLLRNVVLSMQTLKMAELEMQGGPIAAPKISHTGTANYQAGIDAAAALISRLEG